MLNTLQEIPTQNTCFEHCAGDIDNWKQVSVAIAPES